MFNHGFCVLFYSIYNFTEFKPYNIIIYMHLQTTDTSANI